MTDKAALTEVPKQAHVDMRLEMEAITGSAKLFEKLSPEGQQRAFSYLGNVLGLSKIVSAGPAAKAGGSGALVSGMPEAVAGGSIKYTNFAELYHAARPETGWQMVLVGGYWFQVCGQQEEFGAQAVNDCLKEIGAKVANVTVAFNRLKAANPSLVLQLRKSGKAQQARKQYKLTVAGIRAVEQLIGREG